MNWYRRSGLLAAIAVFGVVGAGCSGSSTPAAKTVTVVASPPGSASGSASASGTSTGTASSSTSGSATSSASPSPTSTETLGGGACDVVLPIITVDEVVGHAVVGKTSFIVNQPDVTVGQVQRLNCQYGIAPVKAGSKTTDAKVEVSVSLYATNAQATARVAATEEEWRGNGAVPTDTAVAGHPATILIGYGKPLLVLSYGPRTVAVSMATTVVTAAKRNVVLTALASSALKGAGG